MTAEEIYEQKSKEASDAYEALMNELTKKIKDKYLNQYIKFKYFEGDSDWVYMHIDDIWCAKRYNIGFDREYDIYFEGSFMWFKFKGDPNCMGVEWYQCHQEKLWLNDFNGDVYRENLMVVIDEDEWNKSLNTMLKKIKIILKKNNEE